MEKSEANLQLNYAGGLIEIEMHYIDYRYIFRVVFTNGKPPLILTRAEQPNDVFFWTSVPEGRLKEAQEIGKLISEFYKKNK